VAMQAQRDAATRALRQQAGETAALWRRADVATVHPYLFAKGVQPHGIRLFEDKLLIPVRDAAGMLHSLQTITPDGQKRFHVGGRVKGCYHAIGKPIGPDSMLIVCEGYATAASIHEATGHAVAVAFNSGNLAAVAIALRAKYPALKIIIAADDDHLTDGNPGMTKARAAALAAGGMLAVPPFPSGRRDKATDFNDLHQLAGLDAVKVCIDAAVPINAETGQEWPEPTPLPNALPAVQAFEADLLPVALRGWVMDIAHRMQCPPDFL
jgi:putative DNA primase/helicase